MNAALRKAVVTRVAIAGLAWIVGTACGGEREAASGTGDSATVATAAPAGGDTTPVRPESDSTPTPDAITGTAAATQPAPPEPASHPAPKTEPAPAPKPSPAPEPAAPAPQPAKPPARDTQAPAPAAPAPVQPPAPAAAAPLRDAYHQAPRDTVDQAVYDGWKQYNLNCARCHGEDVLGTTIAPHLVTSLKPDGPINTQEAFVQVVCAGRPEKGMPAWCALGLEMERINQIYSYVKGRSAGEIGPGRPALKPGG